MQTPISQAYSSLLQSLALGSSLFVLMALTACPAWIPASESVQFSCDDARACPTGQFCDIDGFCVEAASDAGLLGWDSAGLDSTTRDVVLHDAQAVDSGSQDRAFLDVEHADIGLGDVENSDLVRTDSSAIDVAIFDAGEDASLLEDAAIDDATVDDAALSDASPLDSSVPDSFAPDNFVPDSAEPDAGILLFPFKPSNNLIVGDVCNNISQALTITSNGSIDTSLGAVNVDGTSMSVTSTLVPQVDGLDVRVFVFSSINIQAALTVTGSYPLALVSCSDFRLEGTIDASAVGASPGPGGYAGGNSSADGQGFERGQGLAGASHDSPYVRTGGGGGSFAGLGGHGGAGSYTQGATYLVLGGQPGQANGSADLIPLVGGSGGGGGGSAQVGGFGGAGGGALQLVAANDFSQRASAYIHVGGGGGQKAVNESGAGGGGGGGGGRIRVNSADGVVNWGITLLSPNVDECRSWGMVSPWP